jgi:hypothetical protein
METCFDLDDIKPSALKRLLKAALLKDADSKKAAKEAAQEAEDKDREDAVDLNEEKKGKYPKVDVTEDDLPSHLFKGGESKGEPKHSKAKGKLSKARKGFPPKKK